MATPRRLSANQTKPPEESSHFLHIGPLPIAYVISGGEAARQTPFVVIPFGRCQSLLVQRHLHAAMRVVRVFPCDSQYGFPPKASPNILIRSISDGISLASRVVAFPTQGEMPLRAE